MDKRGNYHKRTVSERQGDKAPKKPTTGKWNDSEKKEGKTTHKSSKRTSFPLRKNTEKAPQPEKEAIRLNKYIANSGICSRRDADTYIAAGNVMVNGKVVTEMGYQVKQGDEVRFDGKRISPEKKEYVLLNKPKGFITTTDDEKGRKTVMELIAKASPSRLLPVGRLDRNTTGLLLFTNDGDLAKKLIHPKHGIRKIYHVVLDKNLAHADFKKIEAGIKLEDGLVTVDAVSYIENTPKREIGIELHSGKNRIVRRIFEQLGYAVIQLDRVVFAGLTKKNLSRGHWRHLSSQEIANLKML